jgi:hypothetical protein
MSFGEIAELYAELEKKYEERALERKKTKKDQRKENWQTPPCQHLCEKCQLKLEKLRMDKKIKRG